MKSKIFIAITSAILLIIVIVYYNLGGFETVSVIEKKSNEIYMIGRWYEGNVKSQKFQVLFSEIEKIHQSKKHDGYLAGYYKNNPEKNQGNIKAFIGIIVEKNQDSQDNLERLTIPERFVLEGNVKASLNFGISVGKTYNALNNYAEKEKIKVKEEYLEWFPSKNEIFVQIEIEK